MIEGLKFFEKKMESLLDNLFMSIESYKTISNKIMNFLSEYIALEEECVHKALLGY